MHRGSWGENIYLSLDLGIGESGLLWEFVVQPKSHQMPTYQSVASLSLASHLQGEWFALKDQDASPQWRPPCPQCFGEHFKATPTTMSGIQCVPCLLESNSHDPALWISQTDFLTRHRRPVVSLKNCCPSWKVMQNARTRAISTRGCLFSQ